MSFLPIPLTCVVLQCRLYTSNNKRIVCEIFFAKGPSTGLFNIFREHVTQWFLPRYMGSDYICLCTTNNAAHIDVCQQCVLWSTRNHKQIGIIMLGGTLRGAEVSLDLQC